MTQDADKQNATEQPSARTKLPTHFRKVLGRTNNHMLYSEDIGPSGTKVDVEISDITVEKLKNEDGTSEKLSLSFANTKTNKKLALNAGMCETMRKLCDTADPNQWGGWITLVVMTEKIGGDPMEVIRIAPKRPTPKAPKQ